MKKVFPLLVAALAMVLTLSIVGIPKETVHAAIKDGVYEVNYEIKEADNDNTSIADGYFNKPATLTVKDGVKHIQLTVTSSSMIKSLSAPTGEVDIVDENKDEETRTVKFRVDEDLSEPVPMDMHIVVPDLYDTTHTARAVFDTDIMDAVSENHAVNTNTEDDDKAEDESSTGESENNAEVTDEDDESTEVDADEDVSSEEAETEAESQENDNSASVLWIMLAVFGVLIIAGVLFWIFRKKRKE